LILQSNYKESSIGPIPYDWGIVKMEKICEKIIDCLHSKKPTFIEKSEKVYLEVVNIGDLGELNLEYVNYINDKDFNFWTKRIIPKHKDIIITKTGRVGAVAMVPPNLHCCIGRNQVIIRADNNKILSEFLLYYLLSPQFNKELRTQKMAGTILESLHVKNIPKIRVLLPDIKEQYQIVKMLKPLFGKKELNDQINKTLEAIAQAIFKHWFIDFEFPDENGGPYKSSGGEMVDSELGPIPKGWEIKKVGEILKTVLGGTPSKKKKIYWENGKIPWINSGKVNEYRIIEPSEYITELGLEKSSTKLLPKRTTVIAITGATLGKISLLEIDCCANQSIVGILENNIFKSEYIYFWMINIIDSLISWQTGGAQQHVNKDNINKINILIPNEKILQQYYTQVRPIFNKISNNCFENKNLQQLRDLILPKLMSGKIRVPINSKVLISKNN